MDIVDVAIIGVILFWVGFLLGIIAVINKKDEPVETIEIKTPPYYFNQEAKAIVEKFRPFVDSMEIKDFKVAKVSESSFSKEKQTANAKQCALIAVEFAERALTIYASGSNELQNMDEEWRMIDKLKKAIDRYEG